MRILILSQYYPPEVGAPQNRLSGLAQYLMRSGHSVTIITALPNYPKGEIFEEYRGHVMVEEQDENIRIIRTWIYATKHKDFMRRLMNYFSFVFSSLLGGMWKIGRQDVLIVESPPLFLGLSGLLLSWWKGAKLVSNISDLWPESAVAMGVLRNKALIALAEWLEALLYRRSHLITGQTQGIVSNIQSRLPEKRIALITNGANVDLFVPSSQLKQGGLLRKEFGLEGKFVIGYAGLHGLAQGLETVLQAAQLLSGYQDVSFIFFGDGPEKERLIQMAHQARLANVHFYPPQPALRMPEIIASFDIAIVPLKRLDLFKGALPSKLFEAMAAEIPVIVSIDGEARALVDKAQAGMCIEPENPQAMADAILRLYKEPNFRRTLAQNGRKYVIERYDRHQIAKQFECLLLEIHRYEGARLTKQ
jgi:glycosyltransferase involved in cell wall biosynthesis